MADVPESNWADNLTYTAAGVHHPESREALQELVQQGIRWHWLAVALILRCGSLVVTGVRWNLLLASQGIRPSAGRVARIVGVGYVCNFVLPGTVGGDVAKAGLIVADTPERRKRALATVPLDRALGLLAFLLLGQSSWRPVHRRHPGLYPRSF